MTHLSLHLLYVNLMCFYLCCIRFRRVYLSPTTWPSDRISQWTTWSQQWSRCTTTTRPVRLPYEPVLHTHIRDTEGFVTSWPMKCLHQVTELRQSTPPQMLYWVRLRHAYIMDVAILLWICVCVYFCFITQEKAEEREFKKFWMNLNKCVNSKETLSHIGDHFKSIMRGMCFLDLSNLKPHTLMKGHSRYLL